MKPAFGTLEYTVQVDGGGATARPALVSVKGIPKDATVALLQRRIVTAHAKRYPARPALHFAASAPSTAASVAHDLVDSRRTVLAAVDKVPSARPLSLFVIHMSPFFHALFCIVWACGVARLVWV
ncbi:hypothetical protein [Pandoravirus japonicus]|uniref:Uncharacterized protein n=1 Tax=Pandoravirus japonicus TaxID=2823154 RepID=A0A811BQ56_9VIRU|nr:hypothetical protein [Pandoravirus japonicus]